MKNYLALAPDINGPRAAEFAAYIGSQPDIRMPDDVPALGRYVDDLKLLAVPRRPHPAARVKMCWFNCLDYTRENPGSTLVFGWQIHHMNADDGSFGICAFHHAIIRQNNALVDITPYDDCNDDRTILFVPDSRVPYDFAGRRMPLSLFWSLIPMMTPFWTTNTECPNEHRTPGYGVGKPR